MPMDTEESGSQNGQNGTGVSQTNLLGLKLALAYNSYMMEHSMRRNENRSFVSDSADAADDKPETDGGSSETFSVFNYSDDEDHSQSVFECPSCHFDINASVLRYCLEALEPYNPNYLVCPVCDKAVREEKMDQHSSSRTVSVANIGIGTWRAEKSSIWAGNSDMLGKKLAASGTGSICEPKPDSLSSPPVGNMSNEDSMKNASDISNAKSLWTNVSEDCEERKLGASFVQELVLSTMSLEI